MYARGNDSRWSVVSRSLPAAMLAAATFCLLSVSTVLAQLPTVPPPIPQPPDAQAPDTNAPEAKAPDVNSPDVTVPDLPDAKAPETPEQPTADVKTPRQSPAQLPSTSQDALDANAQGNAEVQGNAEAGAEADAKAKVNRQPDAGVQGNVQSESAADGRAGATAAPQANGNAQQRNRLGLSFQSDSQHLTITQITEGSLAARAGLRTSDEIVAINGQRVTSEVEFAGQLDGAAQANGQVLITVWRNGRLEEVSLMADAPQNFSGRNETFYRGPGDVPPPPPGSEGAAAGGPPSPSDAIFDDGSAHQYDCQSVAPRRHHHRWRQRCR